MEFGVQMFLIFLFIFELNVLILSSVVKILYNFRFQNRIDYRYCVLRNTGFLRLRIVLFRFRHRIIECFKEFYNNPTLITFDEIKTF